MSNLIKLVGRIYSTAAMKAYSKWSIRLTTRAVVALTGASPEAVDAYFAPLLVKNERVVAEWRRGEFVPSPPEEVVELTAATIRLAVECMRGTIGRVARAHEALGLPYSRELVDVKIDEVEAELLEALPKVVPGFDVTPADLFGGRVRAYAPKDHAN